MNTVGCFSTFDEAYPAIVWFIKRHGKKVSPRGLSCYEVRPATFTIENPERALYTGAKRKLNYRFFAIETLGYLGGMSDRDYSSLLVAVNKNLRQFVNPSTGTFDGAYGPRLNASLVDVVELIGRDPHTRQAVASIWSPGIPGASLDVPCTVSLHFFANDDKLDLHVYMRSNDVNWGTPYDVAAFCVIQQVVARCVGMEVGEYHHTCGSLHFYDGRIPDVIDDECSGAEFSPYKKMVIDSMSPGTIMRFIQADARAIISLVEDFVLRGDNGKPKRVSDLRLRSWLNCTNYDLMDSTITAWAHLIDGYKP